MISSFPRWCLWRSNFCCNNANRVTLAGSFFLANPFKISCSASIPSAWTDNLSTHSVTHWQTSCFSFSAGSILFSRVNPCYLNQSFKEYWVSFFNIIKYQFKPSFEKALVFISRSSCLNLSINASITFRDSMSAFLSFTSLY